MRSRAAGLLLALAACGGGTGADDAVDGPDAGADPGVGHATYTVGDEVFRIAASAGATPVNVSAALGGSGDRRLVQSANGAWLVFEGTRFGCGGQCLVRVAGDLSGGEAVRPAGEELYPEGIAAISGDGERVVYPAQGGPHAVDLWLTTRSAAGTWSAPTLLTGASTYAYNNMPALRAGGAAVLFDCGSEPYPESGGNDACTVDLDGGNVARLVGPDTLPGAREDKVQNPHEGPDGVLFEASWPVPSAGGDTPEIIWRMQPGQAPDPLGAALPNSVSPCVLADGRWVVLWLGHPDNVAGVHELALVGRDGTGAVRLTPDVDVADIGLGCGE